MVTTNSMMRHEAELLVLARCLYLSTFELSLPFATDAKGQTLYDKMDVSHEYHETYHGRELPRPSQFE